MDAIYRVTETWRSEVECRRDEYECKMYEHDALEDADNSFLAVEMIKRKPPDRRVVMLIRRFRLSFRLSLGGLYA